MGEAQAWETGGGDAFLPFGVTQRTGPRGRPAGPGRSACSYIGDALEQTLQAIGQVRAEELWNSGPVLTRRVDLFAPSGDQGLFVAILRLGACSTNTRRSTFSHDTFLGELAGLGRTDFGPSDFAPGHKLHGFLAVPIEGQHGPCLEAESRSTVEQAIHVGLVKDIAVEGVYSVGPMLTAVKDTAADRGVEAVPNWHSSRFYPAAAG